MSNQTVIFADRISGLSITEGTVRFNLASIDANNLKMDKNGQVIKNNENIRDHLDPQAQVVMTMQGFSQALRAFTALLDKAEKEGLITRKKSAETSQQKV